MVHAVDTPSSPPEVRGAGYLSMSPKTGSSHLAGKAMGIGRCAIALRRRRLKHPCQLMDMLVNGEVGLRLGGDTASRGAL